MSTIFKWFSVAKNCLKPPESGHITKKKATIKEVLNKYQESITGKIFKRITKNHNLSHLSHIKKNKSQRYPRRTDNFSTSEKLRLMLRTHKIRSFTYTEKTLFKLLCKPKDRVAVEDENKIFKKLTAVTKKQSTSMNLKVH